jgi:hypothetical protein
MNALEVNGVRIDAQAIRAESARLRQEALSNGDKVFLEDTLRFSDQAEELLIERVLLDREAARLESRSGRTKWIPPWPVSFRAR